MAIATALRGFNDLGHLGTPTFLSRSRLNLQLFTKLSKKWTEDIKSCYLAIARCVKLWLLNLNLFFKEPHQLTKSSTFILMGHYNHSLLPDATIMVSRNCPTIGEHVVTIFVTQ